ncbi:hypothetical protein [Streptomyces iranensis]|uniref:Regulator component n=1 Tax=Streptomyces iranensis TaxID=576784 RepID=A0A060ZVZ3_9ACTN|nr:hypothetical protein [Streptomyces iranensis]MBP2059597.1 hypothetical protein [Streptomyces iranensis]CDR10464.1 predicted protein [Streptomyces iranensis]
MSLRNRREQPGDRRKARPDFEELLASIDIPEPFEIQVLCDKIAEQRGRALYLHSVPGISGTDAPCGMWIATDVADHVFHEAATTPLHRDHIILHEISHMLLGHGTITDGTQPGVSSLFSGIDPATVISLLNRASYATEDERDAERLAGLIAGKAELSSPRRRPMHHQVLRRLGNALGDSYSD